MGNPNIHQITCCICGKQVANEESHNADSLKEGRCCEACNSHYVLPYRLHLLNRIHTHQENEEK